MPRTDKSESFALSREAAMLRAMYERLEEAYGPQHWWPGETPLEFAHRLGEEFAALVEPAGEPALA